MRITLNRTDLYRFERLVSKLVKSSELPQAISFAPCSDGLQFTAFADAAVLSLTAPSGDVVERQSTTDPFTLPWATVKEFSSKNNGKIDFDVNGKFVALSWTVNDLIRSIKSQRRQDKLLRDTVASLRKLQGV